MVARPPAGLWWQGEGGVAPVPPHHFRCSKPLTLATHGVPPPSIVRVQGFSLLSREREATTRQPANRTEGLQSSRHGYKNTGAEQPLEG